LIADIAIGLHDLHTQGIVHRDLKPMNILVKHEKRSVIADFGIAFQLENEEDVSTWKIGSKGFMAPEVYSGQEYN